MTDRRATIGMFSFFILAGAVVFVFSLTQIVITAIKTKNYKETQGKVVSSTVTVRKNSDGRSVPYRTPIISYEVQGNTYHIKGELQTGMQIQTGTPVSIRYHPDNPQEAIFASNLFTTNFFLLFWGFAVFILSLFMLSMEIETEFFSRLRTALFYLAFGTLGGGTYLFMGTNIGSFNPLTMIGATPWALIPCLFLAVVGIGLFLSIKNKLS